MRKIFIIFYGIIFCTISYAANNSSGSWTKSIQGPNISYKNKIYYTDYIKTPKKVNKDSIITSVSYNWNLGRIGKLIEGIKVELCRGNLDNKKCINISYDKSGETGYYKNHPMSGRGYFFFSFQVLGNTNEKINPQIYGLEDIITVHYKSTDS